jgi:hypothetical protein
MTGGRGGSPQPATLAWPRPKTKPFSGLKLPWRERREIHRDWVLAARRRRMP